MPARTSTIRQVELIPATPEKVFGAIADPKTHSVVIGAEATGKPVVGGKFTSWDGYILGEFLEIVPGKKIVQSWWTTEWPKGAPPSRLEWTFVEKEEQCEVTLLHTDVPAEQAAAYTQGWIEYYWEPLQKYFSKSKKKPGKKPA